MRGTPTTFVPCVDCGSVRGFPHSRRCRTCSNQNLRFVFNPVLDAQLVAVYREAIGKKELSRRLRAFETMTGFSRCAVKERAAKLCVTNLKSRPFSPDEIQFLLRNDGHISTARTAKLMGRAHGSVDIKRRELGLATTLKNGTYSQADVAELFGVSHHLVRVWRRNKHLVPDREERYTHERLCRFVCTAPELFSTRRVNPRWFRSVLRLLAPTVCAKPVQWMRKEEVA